MRRLIAALGALVVGVLAMGALPAVAAEGAVASSAHVRIVPTATGQLSSLGEQAVGDLRRCLSNERVLNVMYLIDDSGSLRNEGAVPGTDPDVARADILASSLAQLGSLGEGISVNWASAFFSDNFEAATPWAPLTDGSAEALAAVIRQKNAKAEFGWTNWLGGLEGAQRSIAAQQQADPGCAVLVWLTDGLPELKKDPDGARRDADINQLCGTALMPGASAPAPGSGTFSGFRQAGVVVLGVLLKVGAPGDPALDGLMVPLVEGQGPFGGAEATCPEHPIPSTAVHGAVLEASDPGDLARVFLNLGAQLAGGWPSNTQPRADGTFDIDPGVSRFRVTLTGSDWELTKPDGAPLGATDEGVTITESSGSTAITVTAAHTDRQGEWRIQPMAAAPELFLFSDLRIAFAEDNQLTAGEAGVARGSIVGPGDVPVDAAHFRSLLPRVMALSADGTTMTDTPLRVKFVDAGVFEVDVPAGGSDSVVRLRAELNPLTTAQNGLALAPLSADEVIPTTMPGHLPTVSFSAFSELEGAGGSTRGVMTIAGPEDADAGDVCITVDPQVNDQRDGWKWTFDGSSDLPICVTVARGETRDVEIMGTNPIPAATTITAVLPLAFSETGSDATVLTQSSSFRFTSTRPVDAGIMGLITLGLLALGVLLPLVILWFVNWLTTTLSIAPNTQRGVLPVSVDGTGVHPSGSVEESFLGANVFQNRPPIERERAIHDADLGVLRARVPWWPVNDTWFEVVPPAATAVVLARTGSRAGSLGSRAQQGDRAVRFSNLPLDAFTAIIVSEDELRRTRKGDAVAARVVMYHRPEPGVADQYTRRIGELRAESDLLGRIDRLRESLVAAGDTSQAAARAAGGTVTPPPAGAMAPAAEATAPPREGTGTATVSPPPRRAGASTPPPRDGAAPPRDGAAPPPRDGAPPPPPPRGR